MTLSASAREAAARLRLLILDVDGVLTDGTLLYGADGEVLKPFHVRDGLGLKLLASEGVAVGVISGRDSAPLRRRLADLAIDRAHLGVRDKGAALDAMLADVGCEARDAAHVGDDLVDLPVFARVGLAIAVADAHPAVREAADWVTETRGGRGAAREVADAILDAQGRLDAILDAYRGGT